MSLKIILDQNAQHELWANTLFVERLKREPEAVLDAPVKSSFPSLRLTLLHIRDAENAWAARLEGRPFSWPAEPDPYIGTLLTYSTRLRDLVIGYDEAALLAQVAYNDLKGNRFTQPRWQMLMHCSHHSAQHRGQLITMMRNLGLDEIPGTDMVRFQRTLSI